MKSDVLLPALDVCLFGGFFFQMVVSESVSYRLGTVDVSSQADNQVVCDGVDQVPEAGVAVQDVIKGC